MGNIQSILREEGDDQFHRRVESLLEYSTVNLARTFHQRKLTGKDPYFAPVMVEAKVISEIFHIVAQLTCIRSIKARNLTRRNAAELLEVHENTIARWVKSPTMEYDLFERLRNLMKQRLIVLLGMEEAEFEATDSEILTQKMVSMHQEALDYMNA